MLRAASPGDDDLWGMDGPLDGASLEPPPALPPFPPPGAGASAATPPPPLGLGAAAAHDAPLTTPGEDADSCSRLFAPAEARLRCGASEPVPGSLNVDHKRVKWACAVSAAALRIPLPQLADCRLAGPAADRPATECAVQVQYSTRSGGSVLLELYLDAPEAVALHSVLVPFLPLGGRAMRAALAGRWGMALGRPVCFNHGDEIPSLIATRDQRLHESEGELRYVLVDLVGRFGRDLHLRTEAKTFGIWQIIQTYSLNAGEMSLVPSALSATGDALCLQRNVEGTSGTVGVEDMLTIEASSSSGLELGGICQRRRYCTGPYCIAETTRIFRFTGRDQGPTGGGMEGDVKGQSGLELEQPLARSVAEACTTGSHQGHDGHVLYSCRVGWSESQADGTEPRVVYCSVAKRYSECVALDRLLRTKGETLTLSETDTRLPALQNRSVLGRDGSKSAQVVAERQAEIEEWLQLALLYPLVRESEQLKAFLSTDKTDSAAEDLAEPILGGKWRRVSGRKLGEKVWDFVPLQVHAVEGKVFYIFRASFDVEDGLRRELQLAKRFSECVKLDEAFAVARRDRPVAERLPKLDAKISADSTDERLQSVFKWLCALGSVPPVWQSELCQQFLKTGSLEVVDPAAAWSLRVCGAGDSSDGHSLYEVAVMPAGTASSYNVTRVPSVKPGQLVQFMHGSQMHHVAVPSDADLNETFVATVNSDHHTVLKRYSEWVTLDEQLRHHPQLASSLPMRLKGESSLFKSKTDTAFKRSAELQTFVSALSVVPGVWQASAMQEFAATEVGGPAVEMAADARDPSPDITINAEAAQQFSASLMDLFLRNPMAERPAWGQNSGPPSGWVALLGAPSIVGQPPSGLADETLAAVAPGWLAQPETLRRIVIQHHSSERSEPEPEPEPADSLIDLAFDGTLSTDIDPGLWLLIETRPVDLSTDWTEACRLSFEGGGFSLRPCGGGRGEILVLRGVHQTAASASDSALDDFFSGGGSAAPADTPFELEISEHPSGLHEQLLWGLPGEAGSCVTSWVRSLWSEQIELGVGTSVSGQRQGVGAGRLVRTMSTSVEVSNRLQGVGWQVLWQRERRFVAGDDVPEVIGRTSGAKTFAIASAVGMSVPIPGFVLFGAAAGAVASTPAMQVKATRFIANTMSSRMQLKQNNSFGDTILSVDVGHRGHWRRDDEYSYNHGDFWLEPSVDSLMDDEEAHASPHPWTKEVLCLRTRLKRHDAVYIVTDLLSLDATLHFVTERRKILSGDVCIATSTRRFELVVPTTGEPEDLQRDLFGATDSGAVDRINSLAHASSSVTSSPGELPMLVRAGWLDMKVKVGWSKRWFEIALVPRPVVERKQTEWKFVQRNPSAALLPPQAPPRRSSPPVYGVADAWMRFVSKTTGEPYFVNERTGQSKKELPPDVMLASDLAAPKKAPEPEPEPEPESGYTAALDSSLDPDMFTIDGLGSDDVPLPAVSPTPMQGATETTVVAGAVLSRQKGSGDEHAASRKDLLLETSVVRCVVTIHKRTIELELREGHGEGSSLQLRAVDEADCASWGRVLQDTGRVETMWQQPQDVDSVM